MIRQPIYICLIGPQGSGKGTQAELLVAWWGLSHLIVGELYREQIKAETALGRQSQANVAKGQYVSDDITNR